MVFGVKTGEKVLTKLFAMLVDVTSSMTAKDDFTEGKIAAEQTAKVRHYC